MGSGSRQHSPPQARGGQGANGPSAGLVEHPRLGPCPLLRWDIHHCSPKTDNRALAMNAAYTSSKEYHQISNNIMLSGFKRNMISPIETFFKV